MQAITTKYMGPTNYRGSRVKATSESGISVTLGWDDTLNSEPNHRAAAVALCAKLDWHGKLVTGALRDGYVHVFAAWALENGSERRMEETAV